MDLSLWTIAFSTITVQIVSSHSVKTCLFLRQEREVWLMPLGHLLDQIEIFKQFHGMSKPKQELTIDDIIPVGPE